MGDRINEQLRLEGIPPVNDELMANRMEYRLMSERKAYNNKMAEMEQQVYDELKKDTSSHHDSDSDSNLNHVG